MHYSKAVDGPRRFFLTALLAVGCSAIAVGSAVAGVKPADPKPFIGEWAIAFPEGAGVIVNKPDTTCDAPAIISAGRPFLPASTPIPPRSTALAPPFKMGTPRLTAIGRDGR